MTEPVLITSRQGAVLELKLNRPSVGNAMNLEMTRALAEAATLGAEDAEVRCVVLTGAGKIFCAGGDLNDFAAAGDDAPTLLNHMADHLHGAIERFMRMRKPLIVVVNGPAAGAGLGLALAGDHVLASQSAHFTASYTGVGLSPDGGLTWSLPRLVGVRRAQEMIFTNRRVGAEEAVKMGLVTEVVSDDRLIDAGRDLAARFAASAIGAIGSTKALLLASFDGAPHEQLARETQSIIGAAASGEAREGFAAFLQRRPADFANALRGE